jgi:hypothetical protein
MTSSSLKQSIGSLLSMVGSVQTDFQSWLELVPGCLQYCKTFLIGESIIILCPLSYPLFDLALQIVLQCSWWWKHHLPVLIHEYWLDQYWGMYQSFYHECSVVHKKSVQDCWVLLSPPHHWNILVRPEGFDDMQEHKCSIIMGALGVTNHDYKILKSNSFQSKWDEVRSKMLWSDQAVWLFQWFVICLRTV